MIELSDDPNYPKGNPEEIPEANLEENPEQPVDENADGTGGQESVVMAETQKKQTADLINMLDELDEKGVPILKTAVATAEGKTVGVVGLPSFIRGKRTSAETQEEATSEPRYVPEIQISTESIPIPEVAPSALPEQAPEFLENETATGKVFLDLQIFFKQLGRAYSKRYDLWEIHHWHDSEDFT